MARFHVLTAAVPFGTAGTAQAHGPDIEPLAVGSARIVVGAARLPSRASSAAALVLAGRALLALRVERRRWTGSRAAEAPA